MEHGTTYDDTDSTDSKSEDGGKPKRNKFYAAAAIILACIYAVYLGASPTADLGGFVLIVVLIIVFAIVDGLFWAVVTGHVHRN